MVFRRKPPHREQVREWCAHQMKYRAESLEAQQLTLDAEEAGWSSGEVMWKFLTSQWPVVLREAEQHFRSAPIERDLLTDVGAMSDAVHAFGPALYPLTHVEPTEEVLVQLHEVADKEGWS